MALTSVQKSAVKALSWRAVAAVDTFALSWLITGHMGAAAGIVSFEIVTKSVIYFAHERAWELKRPFWLWANKPRNAEEREIAKEYSEG